MGSSPVCPVSALVLVVIAVVVAIVATVFALIQFKHSRQLKQRVETLEQVLALEHKRKVKNVSNFLEFCSAYVDRFEEFGRVARRKIKAGQVDDLYNMINSHRISEDETRRFLSVFDKSFLYIFPHFIEDLNRLLCDDSQIEITPGSPLPTEVRILAFMRIGVSDSNRIAKFMGLSINTIYTYRNKMKGRAINRDTFESQIGEIRPSE